MNFNLKIQSDFHLNFRVPADFAIQDRYKVQKLKISIPSCNNVEFDA